MYLQCTLVNNIYLIVKLLDILVLYYCYVSVDVLTKLPRNGTRMGQMRAISMSMAQNICKKTFLIVSYKHLRLLCFIGLKFYLKL